MSDPDGKNAELTEACDAERVLIVAPTGRDAAVVAHVLTGAGVVAHPCLFAAMLQELKGQSMDSHRSRRSSGHAVRGNLLRRCAGSLHGRIYRS